MSFMMTISREDLAEALKIHMPDADENAIHEFADIFFPNRFDEIIDEEARKFAGTYGTPPLGYS